MLALDLPGFLSPKSAYHQGSGLSAPANSYSASGFHLNSLVSCVSNLSPCLKDDGRVDVIALWVWKRR